MQINSIMHKFKWPPLPTVEEASSVYISKFITGLLIYKSLFFFLILIWSGCNIFLVLSLIMKLIIFNICPFYIYLKNHDFTFFLKNYSLTG